MRLNLLLLAILVTCLVGGCSGSPVPAPGPGPTPNPFEPTPTTLALPVTGSHNGGGTSVTWSPSGKWIAISTGNGVYLYDGNPQDPPKIVKLGQAFRYAGFGKTDNLVVLIDSHFTVTDRDIEAGNDIERRGIIEIDQIDGLCPDGKFETYPQNFQLVCLDQPGKEGLEKVRDSFLTNHAALHREWVSADGSLWGVAYNIGHVEADVYNIATGAKIATYATPEAVVPDFFPDFSLALSSGGELVAVGDFAGDVTVWNASSKKILYDCKADFPVKQMSFSPDHKKLALIDEEDHTVLELAGSGCNIHPF